MLFPSTTLLVVSTFLIGSSDAMNVIVMQPDDLEYFNAWTPPPNSKDFFMYFNPTVPHGSNDIEMALTQFNCTDTANGSLDFEPIVPGMMGTHTTCKSYRKSIFERAESADDYGPIWLDDGVGGLIKALEDNNILDDTLFLFQIDHGMATKGALYEGGNKISQFIHYPSKIVGGSTSNALVSTIDIAPTIYDFAGITLDYDLDGISWKGVIENANNEEDFFKNERCLFFEMEQDRAVRCGCWKYLKINDITSSSTTITRGNQFGLSNLEHNAFDLCDGTDEYITDDGNNREVTAANLYGDSNRFTSALKQQFEDAMTCHLERTTHDAINQFASCGPQM